MDLDTANRKFQKELNAGAGALVILGLLQRSGRAMYGYEIGKQLELLAEGAMPMQQGALYPTLRSLEKCGLLVSEVEPPVAGPPRRYYGITELGHRALVDWQAAWKRTKYFVDSVLNNPCGQHDCPTAPDHPTVSQDARTQAAGDPGGRGRGGTRRRSRILTE